MTAIFLFPEAFEPEDSRFPVSLRRPPEPEPHHTSDKFEKPADFGAMVTVLKKYPELRVSLFKAMREEGRPQFSE
jgi:hypothetical protein